MGVLGANKDVLEKSKRENHTQKRAALLYPNNNIPDENLRGIF